MTQAHIFYSGTVQGIGFRYTTSEMAQELGLCGWVKNLPDGRVEIVAEGKKNVIEQLMQEVEKHFGGYIKNKQMDFSPPQNKFKDFQITR